MNPFKHKQQDGLIRKKCRYHEIQNKKITLTTKYNKK